MLTGFLSSCQQGVAFFKHNCYTNSQNYTTTVAVFLDQNTRHLQGVPKQVIDRKLKCWPTHHLNLECFNFFISISRASFVWGIFCYSYLPERNLTLVFLSMYDFPSHENLSSLGYQHFPSMFVINKVVTLAWVFSRWYSSFLNPSCTKLFRTHTLYQGGHLEPSPTISHQHLVVQRSNFARY